MLQELREAVNTATKLVAEIEIRFKSGDAADELITQLGTRVAVFSRYPVDKIPAAVRNEIAQLLVRIRDTVGAGEEWLERTGPELASRQCQQRLHRAYGIT